MDRNDARYYTRFSISGSYPLDSSGVYVMARLCMYCYENPAEVPDRNVMGRPIKRVCRPCHKSLLLGDLKQILEHRKKRREMIDGERK